MRKWAKRLYFDRRLIKRAFLLKKEYNQGHSNTRKGRSGYLSSVFFPLDQLKAFWTLIVFISVVFFIIRSFNNKKHRNYNRIKFKIDYGTIPIIGVLILILTFNLNNEVLLRGIIGSQAIHPYGILIIFFSLAYICISLDSTGLFSYIALKVALHSGNSIKKLFFYFFILSGSLTIFTSNDIVILTLTPIIIYFSQYTKINPMPFLIAQFFSANIWSCFLYIGNPTNIIVSQAFNLGFLEYLQWSALPTIFAGIGSLLIMLWVFRKDLHQPIQLPDLSAHTALKDKPGAIIGVVVLLSCLLLLSLDHFVKAPLWIICLSSALIMLSKDLIFDFYRANVFGLRLVPFPTEDRTKGLAKGVGNSVKPTFVTYRVVRLVPWKVLPFVLGMFILVEGLVYAGWVDVMARGMSQASQTVPSALFLFMGMSVLFSNLMNNQPMTILFTQILASPSFLVLEAEKMGSIFALIFGSNFGANFTPLGALAGIMWLQILSKKGIALSYRHFFKYGVSIMPIVILIATLVLLLEVRFAF